MNTRLTQKLSFQVFDSKGGDRPEISDVIVLLGDGGTSDGIRFTRAQAVNLKKHHVKIFTVAIGALKEKMKKEFSSMAYAENGKKLFYEAVATLDSMHCRRLSRCDL